MKRLALALVALAVLAVAAALVGAWHRDLHLGMIYEANSGRVVLVEQGGPAAAAGLRSGDTLTTLGLVPLGGTPIPVAGLLPASVRQGAVLGVRWVQQPMRSAVPWDFVLLLASIASLWFSGALVGTLSVESAAARFFALFALLGALALCSAAVQDPPVSAAQWLVAPSAFGALICYGVLQRALVQDTVAVGVLDVVLAGQALLVALAVDFGPRVLGASSGRPLALIAAVDMVCMVIVAHVRAIRGLGQEPAAPVQRRGRLGLLIGFVSWLPALLLGWLPVVAGLLAGGFTVPISPAFAACSLIVPAVIYPAIVARRDLYALERAVRRLAVSLVAAVALLTLVALAVHGIDLRVHPSPDQRLLFGLLLALAALPLFEPTRGLLQRGLDRRLATGDREYSAALEAIGDALLHAVDEGGIAAALTSVAPPLLGITHLRAWLRGPTGSWLFFPDGPGERRSFELPPAPGYTDGATVLPAPPIVPPSLPAPDQPFPPPRDIAMTGVALCVPVRIGTDLRGLLLLGPRHSQDPYRRPERDALMLVARQVAAALQLVDRMAELRARNAELAQLTSRLARAREEERKHLSHELHDEVAQDLVAITRQLRRHAQGDLSDAIRHDLIAQSQEALTAIRRICNDLRPAILDLGLTSALRELIDRVPQRAQPLQVHLEVNGPEQRLDEEREFALYRVAQEALANVLKHAGASEVTVNVRFSPAGADVEVHDNGHGFAMPHRLEDIAGDHLGLLGMRERLAGLGGAVRVESQPGQGTHVCAHVPT